MLQITGLNNGPKSLPAACELFFTASRERHPGGLPVSR